jgi:hypothetical protein
MYSIKIVRWFAICGAMLWVVTGLLLAMRPGGDPPATFRKSADLIPLLAVGLAMIGVSSGFNVQIRRQTKMIKSAGRLLGLSSLSYALGVLIRHLFLQATGWEPFMPFGFLGFIIFLALLGVLSFRSGFLSRLTSFLMIASAISLLTFNDQYNPYGAVVFGLLAIFTVLLSGEDQNAVDKS